MSTGWKVVGKLKEENYFKTDPAYIRQPPQTNPAEDLKKILAKNAAKVWKPAGTGKSLDTHIYVKPPLPVKPPELPKKELKPESAAKKWTPSSKLKASFPNTWLPESNKEPKASTPKTPKPSSKPITKKPISKPDSSTPNMSLVIGDKPLSGLVDNMEEIIKEEELINEMMSKNSSTKQDEPSNELPTPVVEDKSNLNQVISNDEKSMEANKSIEDEKETEKTEQEKEITVENEIEKDEEIIAENKDNEEEIINKSKASENPVNDDDEEDDEANQLWNQNFEDNDSDT